mmetsp:Transcript_3230/g.5004  ORF Transcript_3230/g.5004 Transcript_3230/m.5004 type:complete len:228 (+) Transcript_3230:117-800(+)
MAEFILLVSLVGAISFGITTTAYASNKLRTNRQRRNRVETLPYFVYRMPRERNKMKKKVNVRNLKGLRSRVKSKIKKRKMRCLAEAQPIANGRHMINGIIPFDSESCSICLETFQANDIMASLPCWHTYHLNCLAPWLKSHETCPNCKTDLKPDHFKSTSTIGIYRSQHEIESNEGSNAIGGGFHNEDPSEIASATEAAIALMRAISLAEIEVLENLSEGNASISNA